MECSSLVLTPNYFYLIRTISVPFSVHAHSQSCFWVVCSTKIAAGRDDQPWYGQRDIRKGSPGKAVTKGVGNSWRGNLQWLCLGDCLLGLKFFFFYNWLVCMRKQSYVLAVLSLILFPPFIQNLCLVCGGLEFSTTFAALFSIHL